MTEDGNKNDEKSQKGNSSKEFSIQEYKLVPNNYVIQDQEDDDIDLIELVKTVWDNRKTIYKFVGGGIVLGLMIALLSPKEYRSVTTLMPEYSSDSQGGTSDIVKQFGGLVGLNGNSYSANSNAIRVDLYPEIVQSLPFQIELLETEFYFKNYDTTATAFDYFNDIYTPSIFSSVLKHVAGFPSLVINFFSSPKGEDTTINKADSTIISLTKEQFGIIEEMRDRVSVSLDDESGIVTVSALMPEPRVSAEVTRIIYDRLTEYLVEYRTEKVTIDLYFIQERLKDVRERFNEAQLRRAEFEDSNRGTLSARADTERERLQSEYDLAFNVYNALAQRYEEAKLKVQEETPVFKVLQPTQVPVDDEVSGFKILTLYVIISVLLSVIWIFARQVLASYPFKSKEVKV